jgi:hypothetical protein
MGARAMSIHQPPASGLLPRGRRPFLARGWLGVSVLAQLGLGCTKDNPAFDEPRETVVADGSGTENAESGEENSGDGDPGDGDPGDGDGDGDGDPGDGDGDPGDGDGDPGDGDPGDGDGDGDCQPPLSKCDGECVNLDEDLANCGECGQECSGACLGGNCLGQEHRIVFVGSLLHNGAFGGLGAADAFCTGLASQAGLDGLFMAWLSSAQLGPATRMVHFGGPYQLPNGQLIANNWADLIDGTLVHPIDLDESGGIPPASATCQGDVAWTNTKPDGTPLGQLDCLGWTSAALSAMSNAGRWTQSDATWTASDCVSVTCGAPVAVYCFQQ